MNIKAFFVDALSSALELGVGTPSDVLRHVTPDVLAQHLPRPLWARLLAACLGAPRVDAQLVVETLGVANLCEHVPSNVIWACISEIGARSLGKGADVAMASANSVRTVLTPPPDVVAKPTPPLGTHALGPSIPKPTPVKGLPVQTSPAPEPAEGDRPASTTRMRSPTGQRLRQSGTGVRTLGGVSRRPQAAAGPLPSIGRGNNTPPKRDPNEYETETAVESADWREKEIVVDDEQLVDWQADPGAAVTTAITGDDDFSDLRNRKR